MIVLYLESFENNLFELDFSISKNRVSTVKPSQEDELFYTVMKCFSRFLLLSINRNTSESIRLCFRKKSDIANWLIESYVVCRNTAKVVKLKVHVLQLLNV